MDGRWDGTTFAMAEKCIWNKAVLKYGGKVLTMGQRRHRALQHGHGVQCLHSPYSNVHSATGTPRTTRRKRRTGPLES